MCQKAQRHALLNHSRLFTALLQFYTDNEGQDELSTSDLGSVGLLRPLESLKCKHDEDES